MSAENIDEKTAALEKKLEALTVSDEGSAALVSAPPKDEKKPRHRKNRLSYEEEVKLIEEDRKNKKVIESGLTGTVKWYSIRDRYGFIERADGGKDIFVHQRAITKSRIEKFFYRNLAGGEKVLFDVVEGSHGPEAANVSGPDGADVKGYRFHYREPSESGPQVQKHRSARRIVKSESDVLQTEDKDSAAIEKKPGQRVRKHRRSRPIKNNVSSEDAEPESPEQDAEQRGGRRHRKTSNANVAEEKLVGASHGDAAAVETQV